MTLLNRKFGNTGPSRRLWRTIAIAVMLFCFVPANATTWYVSTTGDDNGSGSSGSPYLTIAKAATMVGAGDTVLVSGGTYMEKNITPAASGTREARIVFKPLTGSGPVVIKHPATSGSDNTPVFLLSGRSYIWIEGFEFRDFSFGKASIFMSAGKGNVVVNNHFENLGNGEVASWDGNQVVALFNCTDCVVRNNFFRNIFGDGINVNSQNARRNLVCHNTFIEFHGKLRSWGGDYTYSRAIDVQDMSDGNNVIAFNAARDVVHHIWLDRDGSNNVVLRNYGHTGSGQVFNESRCARNVIQENISVNMKVGFMSAYYETTGWTIEPRWINNVACNNQTGFKIHKSDRDEFRNNIAFNNRYSNLVFTAEAYSNTPHIFQNNLWYTENEPNSIEFRGTAVPVSEFQEAVEEVGGLSADPLFTDMTDHEEDFGLQPSSPAIGAGHEGVDMGVYAVYGAQTMGKIADQVFDGPRVFFSQVISAGARDTQLSLELRLSSAAAETVSAVLVPVAGDAREGSDFSFEGGGMVSFEPGETVKQVAVNLLGRAEHDELLALRLEAVSNALPGARNLHLIRLFKTPVLVADAGADQQLLDLDGDGLEMVQLDASGSSSPLGSIDRHLWTLDGDTIAAGESPQAELPVGVHSITLTVRDADGKADSDRVVITIIAEEGIWLEAECGLRGSMWNTGENLLASGNYFMSIAPGYNSTESADADPEAHLVYNFEVREPGTYYIFARVICPDATDDSFWLKINNSSFLNWNNIGPATSWSWESFSTGIFLAPGTHTLTIAYREDGAMLDKLWITRNRAELKGMGAGASNCSAPVADAGDDQPYCNTHGEIVLGGDPSASGGIGAYTYSWICIAPDMETYGANTSDILNDTAAANPVLEEIFPINDTLVFELRVRDWEGGTGRDTVNVSVSSLGIKGSDDNRFMIMQGEEIQIAPFNIINGIAPFRYRWTPGDGLSDRAVEQPLPQPDTTTIYVVEVIDALGCSVTDSVHIRVESLGIASPVEGPAIVSYVFPNPLTDRSILYLEGDIQADGEPELRVLNSLGQVVLRGPMPDCIYPIGSKGLSPGMYYYVISNKESIISKGKLIK